MSDTDSSSFIRSIRQIAKRGESQKVDLVTGTVSSITPLVIDTEEVKLTAAFLIVGALCQATTINIPTRDANTHLHSVPAHTTQPTAVSSFGTHTHQVNALNTIAALPNIQLWRGLEVGDQVFLLRMADSQQYYVLQRKEGIT